MGTLGNPLADLDIPPSCRLCMWHATSLASARQRYAQLYQT